MLCTQKVYSAPTESALLHARRETGVLFLGILVQDER